MNDPPPHTLHVHSSTPGLLREDKQLPVSHVPSCYLFQVQPGLLSLFLRPGTISQTILLSVTSARGSAILLLLYTRSKVVDYSMRGRVYFVLIRSRVSCLFVVCMDGFYGGITSQVLEALKQASVNLN